MDENVKLHQDGHPLAPESHIQLTSGVTDALDGIGFSRTTGPI